MKKYWIRVTKIMDSKFFIILLEEKKLNNNFMKKTFLLVALSLLISNTSKAIDINKDLKLIPTIGLYSQKIAANFGAVGNRNQPAPFGEVALRHSGGAFAVLNFTQDRHEPADAANGTYDYERCGTIGFSPTFGKITPSISFEDCRIDTITDQSTGTFYLGLSGEVTKELTLYANYWKDDNKGIAGLVAGNWWLDKGYNGGFSYAHPIATAGFAYGVGNNFTKWYKPSLSKEFAGINFSLAYWNVDVYGGTNYVSTEFKRLHTREHVILSVSKSF